MASLTEWVSSLATRIGGEIKGYTTDAVAKTRVDRDARIAVRDFNKRSISRIDAATLFTEAWANTSLWTGSGTVSGGRMYSAAGLIRVAPTNTRWVARSTLHATGAASKYAYFGVGSSSAANDLVGIGQGSASTQASILRGSNISAGNLAVPRALPTLAAGDYICTVARDETTVSFTIQNTTGGQNVWGARVPVAAFPGGVVNTIFLSANDTVGGGLNWGPVTIYSELAIPPSTNWTVGGVALWGTNKPLSFYRADATTGIGHIISIPGDMDSRKPAPTMLFMHQASTGVALTPWSDSRMANVTSAMEVGGYIIASSDNGPDVTAGGTQDKFANQAGQDDYAALVSWVREHFYTGSLVLLGPSQGSFFAQNFLMGSQLGDIAAVATISGGSNLLIMEQDPAYQAALRTAYGAADTPAFLAAATPFDPITKSGWKFRGVPQKFYVGSTDTTAPPAVQVTPFVNKILPYVPEATVVSLAVGHLDASLYQGSNMLAFFQKYVKNADYEVESALYSRRAIKNAAVTLTSMASDFIERVDIVTDGTPTAGWIDRFQVRFVSSPGATPRNVFTLNEYGEPRITPAKVNTVAFRLFAKEFNSDPARDVSIPLFEIFDNRDNRGTLYAIYGDGDTYINKDLEVNGDVDVNGSLVVAGTVTGTNIGLKISGIYNSGSEPASPNGTIILVRP